MQSRQKKKKAHGNRKKSERGREKERSEHRFLSPKEESYRRLRGGNGSTLAPCSVGRSPRQPALFGVRGAG